MLDTLYANNQRKINPIICSSAIHETHSAWHDIFFVVYYILQNNVSVMFSQLLDFEDSV